LRHPRSTSSVDGVLRDPAQPIQSVATISGATSYSIRHVARRLRARNAGPALAHVDKRRVARGVCFAELSSTETAGLSGSTIRDVSKVQVAVVAPTLRILGGQAVQADRLLRSWHNSDDIDAWLVPINPVPPGPLRFALDVKFLRTIATELMYVPLLARELARADIVHVFSASYSSFL